jgi:uncharacterized protein YkwD
VRPTQPHGGSSLGARQTTGPATFVRALATVLATLVLLTTSCQSIVEDMLESAALTEGAVQAEQYVASIAAQINAARVSEGLTQLRWSVELADAAQQHAQDMADNGFVSHTGSDGSDLAGRMESFDYAPRFRGEIVVWASGGPQAAMNWWWNSPLHRSTMLGTSYADYGVGVTPHPQHAGQFYYVVVFGAR